MKRGNQGDVKEMLLNIKEKDEKREQLVLSRRQAMLDDVELRKEISLLK